MTTLFIIHGVGGSSQENWFPWLREQLERRGYRVIVPQFPTPENQTLSHWFETLEHYGEFITPETIFVGHSLGVPFVLNVIEKNPIRAAFLVAGFVGLAGNSFDDSMKTFAQRSFDWDRIKENCKNFFIFHSDNDSYVPLQKAQRLAALLGVEVTLVPGGGHLNRASGYTKFDLLLERIRLVLND